MNTNTVPNVNSSRADPTRIQVLIVGCGFAGLACAIEAKRKQHDVVVFEKREDLETLGDVISFAANTGRLFERWGIADRLASVCTQHPYLHMHDHQGNLLHVQSLPQKIYGSNSYNGRRGEIHKILLNLAKDLGVEFRFGTRVIGYYEDDERGKAGVELENGEKVEVDIVVGADGVRSKARELVLGYDDRPQPSGYAIYRAWYNAKERGADKNPLTEVFCRKGGLFYGWVGADLHMLGMSFHDGEEICWVLTHKDDGDIIESWSHPGKISDVLEIIKDWDPRCKALVELSPGCIDWKLVRRDPLPSWVSRAGYIVLIGDAAHPCLPTAVQGASQGVEDGVALACALKMAGKGRVPLATRVFERLRYDRARKVQDLGESTRDKFHKRPSPEKDDSHRDEPQESEAELPFPEWLLNHDVEQHILENFDKVARTIESQGYQLPSQRCL